MRVSREDDDIELSTAPIDAAAIDGASQADNDTAAPTRKRAGTRLRRRSASAAPSWKSPTTPCVAGFCLAGLSFAAFSLTVLLFAMGLGFGLTCANNDAACRPKSNAECSGAACAHKRSDGVTSQLYMYDSASDGWEGNAYTIYRSFDGMRVADGTLKHQRYGTQCVCAGGGTRARLRYDAP